MKPVILFSLLFFMACSPVPKKIDLVLTDAHVITVNPHQSRAEAVAITGNKIIWCGPQEGINKFITKDTRVIDLKGKTVIPGFIDAHAHFLGLGNSLITLDLKHVKNWDEAVAMVQAAVQKAQPGEWITGRGWHQEKWDKAPNPAVNGYPVHTSLSKISPDNPVMLQHASGHGCMANARAMALAGITKQTPDTTGGVIIRDDKGNPTGIFLETAEEMIANVYERHIHSLSKAQQRQLNIRKINAAGRYCQENGVTTFHDAGEPFEVLDLYKELAAKDSLGVRLWAMIREDKITNNQLKKYRTIGYGNNFLTIRAIKEYMDGALGSRGAWLLQPYSDMPSTYGENVTPLPVIRHAAELAIANDYQLCVHAIGDRANRETLNIFRGVLGKTRDRRWRIEHAQHIAAQDLNRFAENGIIASMQTVHCTSDGPWVAKRIGDKRAEEGAYVWQKLLHAGARLANGTDCPVEDLSPIKNYYAAVTRKLNDGSRFYPNQCLSREQALESLTIWNAYAGFEENIKGSVEAGKLADLVILSQDILTVPEEQIPNITVEMTILNGKVVYHSTSLNSLLGKEGKEGWLHKEDS